MEIKLCHVCQNVRPHTSRVVLIYFIFHRPMLQPTIPEVGFIEIHWYCGQKPPTALESLCHVYSQGVMCVKVTCIMSGVTCEGQKSCSSCEAKGHFGVLVMCP